MMIVSLEMAKAWLKMLMILLYVTNNIVKRSWDNKSMINMLVEGLCSLWQEANWSANIRDVKNNHAGNGLFMLSALAPKEIG